MYFRYLNYILVFSLSGCSILEIEEEVEEIIEENISFMPLEVESGLIEMEGKDNGSYIAPEMVLINSGTFTIKNNNINIKDEFFIGKYEVSFEEYDKFARANKKKLPSDNGWGRGKMPVTNITYDEAVAYAEWLSQKSGDKYRLPNEAEWEFASKEIFTKELGYYGWIASNSYDSAHQIGEKLPNSLNIHDLVGNVWEWCADNYQPNILAIPNDGKAKKIKNSDERVAKGGSWNDSERNLKTSNRMGFISSLKMNDTGFRLVMEVKKKNKMKGLK
jgi:formylglycine-generating enzyme required for sulfatase activity